MTNTTIVARSAETVHDLRLNDGLTFALLDDTHRWRERLVEEILLEDGDHVAVTSAYQIRLPAEVIQRFKPGVKPGDQVRLLLPLTTRPKDLLLGVDLTGPNGPCALLLKSQIATLQLEYVKWVSQSQIDVDVQELLLAVFTFNGGTWGHFRTEYAKLTKNCQLSKYLSEGLGLSVEPEDVDRLTSKFEPARSLLLEALDEPAEEHSALDNIVLALPFAQRAPSSLSEIDLWLTKLDRFVRGASEETRALLAEYGRRWEVIVDVALPVAEPCKVKLATRRPWKSDQPDRTVQRIGIGDAATAHVDVRVADHSVKIRRKPELRTLRGNNVAIPVVDDLRFTDDTVTIYVSNDENRPYYLDLTIHLALRKSTQRASSMLWLLIAVAIVASLLMPQDDQLADKLALLVFPLTLAGTVALTRSTTGVAQRLQEKSRGRLVVAIGLMWLVAVIRLITQGTQIEWTGATWEQIVNALMFW